MSVILSLGGALNQPETLVFTYLVSVLLILFGLLALRGPTGFQKFVNSIDAFMVVIAQIVIVLLMGMIFISIVLRTTFGVLGMTIPDASLFSQMMMVAIVFFTVGNAQKIGAHIEVTAIANLLPARINTGLRILALIVGAVIIGGSAWFSAIQAAEDYYSHAIVFSSILYLLEWPGRTLVPIGLGWWTLRMTMQIFMRSERYSDLDHIEDRLSKVG
jgi:TRAP-type C4-dicarboxylate transport system permease small subunit